MKRCNQSLEEADFFLSNKKQAVSNNFHHENSKFSNDVIGLIFSFIPFRQIQSKSLQLISRQWQESLMSDFRFELIHGVENYLSQEFRIVSDSELTKDEKETNMTRLLVTVKQWLYAKQHSLTIKYSTNIIKSMLSEWLITKLTTKRNPTTFPAISISKMEILYDDVEEFVVLNIHLNSVSTLKMTIFYSTTEDIIMYVDIVKGLNEFDWKTKLNIDPTVKRNTVLYVNAKDFEDSDCEIEYYQVNQKFFDSLFKEIELPTTQVTPIDSFLWNFERYNQYREALNPEIICDVEFEKDIEIHDERANYLINRFDFEQINEPEVLGWTFTVGCKKFSSIQEEKIEKNCEISVSNVSGRIVTINLNRKPRRCANVLFDLHYKGSTATAIFILQQNFYYGHDGYESKVKFHILSSDPKFKQLKRLYCCLDGDELRWDSYGELTFDQFRKFLTQLLEITPRYNLLSDKELVSNHEELCNFIVGSEKIAKFKE